MGFADCLQKWKRVVDYFVWGRKFIISVILTLVFLKFWYFGTSSEANSNPISQLPATTRRCIEDRLMPFHAEEAEGNAKVYFENVENSEGESNGFFPIVGNGLFALSVAQFPSLYVKNVRTLSSNVGWSPLVKFEQLGVDKNEAMVTHFLTGIVNVHTCYSNGLLVSTYIYAHRSRPNILVQEIRIVNPSSEPVTLRLIDPVFNVWPSAKSRLIRLFDSKKEKISHHLISGVIDGRRSDGLETVLAVLRKSVPELLKIEAHKSMVVEISSIIHVDVVPQGSYKEKQKRIEDHCSEIFKNLTRENVSSLKQEHINGWFKLWESGLYISHSKAANALNGDKINATIYYVLSNVLLHRNLTSGSLNSTNVHPVHVDYTVASEGCYGGYHHTLPAVNLWRNLITFNEVAETVSLWLLTLEKQGCHKLIANGAFGVLQAMLLSFGGFRFNSQHLEFKIDPKFLHRDYHFRRLRYNERTLINVTVALQDDNKAQLSVALDRSDKPYFACDGGCMDDPKELAPTPIYFPVKLTEPITSILYITSDRNHMELIKDTLHVHKIVEAPAHDHHVIALHRHGHHLGGLPALFWAAVCFLIIIFHLFLFKLIFNEYCDKQDRYKVRYGKVSL